MKSPSPKIQVPRVVATFLPPVLALALALIYHQWQAGKTGSEVSALCAQFKPGDSVAAFVRAAHAADFEVRDDASDPQRIIAVRDVYRLQHESYRCNVQHDGTRILAAETSMVVLD
jgi:hypothetical protein